MDLEINKTIEELIISIENNVPEMKKKLNVFLDSFDKEFTTDNIDRRVRAENLTWALMDGPLTLYALDMNGPAIIDLHSVLERFAIRETVGYLAKQSKKEIAIKAFERFSLPAVVSILIDLNILNKGDLKFVNKLNKIRNGLAHKNPKIISNVVCAGKDLSFLDIDLKSKNIDCIPLIIESICLLMKLSSEARESNNNYTSFKS